MKPTAAHSLREARELLKTRGWTPSSVQEREVDDAAWSIFGPAEGPLTAGEALWAASCYAEGLCNPSAACRGAELLCKTLGAPEDAGFAALGAWCRREGRTQEEVIRLFSLTIQAAHRRLFEVICAAADEDVTNEAAPTG